MLILVGQLRKARHEVRYDLFPGHVGYGLNAKKVGQVRAWFRDGGRELRVHESVRRQEAPDHRRHVDMVLVPVVGHGKVAAPQHGNGKSPNRCPFHPPLQ